MTQKRKVKATEEKRLEDYTEGELREMFVDMFFWVSENRPDWLQECIDRKKRILGETETERRLSARKHE